MDQSLTIVLPMHNCERQIRSSVQDIFDVTRSLPCVLKIIVVDDGSTDDTYETACEMARQYPQVMAFRQPVRQGQNAALELVRNRVTVEKVLVHDGISVIDAAQIQTLLQPASSPVQAQTTNTNTTQTQGSRRFAAVRALHNSMEQAHRSAVQFRWVQLEKPLIPRRRATTQTTPAAEAIPAPNAPVQLVNLPAGLPITMPTGSIPLL